FGGCSLGDLRRLAQDQAPRPVHRIAIFVMGGSHFSVDGRAVAMACKAILCCVYALTKRPRAVGAAGAMADPTEEDRHGDRTAHDRGSASCPSARTADLRTPAPGSFRAGRER